MRVARPLAAFVLVLVPLAAQTVTVQPAKAEVTTETRTVPLAQGSVLKVRNVNGFVKVEAWDKAEVQFTGEFKPSSRDEQVKVVLESSAKGLEIRGEYPKHMDGFMYRGPVCHMTLKVPRKVLPSLESVNGEVSLDGTQGAAHLSTVNGAIRAKGLDDSLKAETVNGAITLERTVGPLELKTVNGTIKGSGLDGQGRGIEASTVNGGIHLQLGGIKGRLKASTVNGGITFNAKGAEQVEVKKHKVTATFPGSEQTIDLGTVNGGITLD